MRFREFVEFEDELELYDESVAAVVSSLAQKFPRLANVYGPAFTRVAAQIASESLIDVDHITEEALVTAIKGFMQGGAAWLKTWGSNLKNKYHGWKQARQPINWPALPVPT